ncbi:MAG: hypothetical protein ACKO90_28795, partial [Microcystis panniformis]
EKPVAERRYGASRGESGRCHGGAIRGGVSRGGGGARARALRGENLASKSEVDKRSLKELFCYF